MESLAVSSVRQLYRHAMCTVYTYNQVGRWLPIVTFEAHHSAAVVGLPHVAFTVLNSSEAFGFVRN